MTSSTARRMLVALAALAVGIAMAVPSAAYERPGRTLRVSVSSTGEQADVDAKPPKFIPNSKGYIESSGRYITFEGWAPNLVAEDREGILRPHIYRHDLATGETIRVSVRYDGRKSNQGGRGAQQSNDGRYVAFYSAASDMFETPDTTRGTDVYVRDMQLGVNEKISVAPDGSDGSNGSTINTNNAYLGDISADGRYVTFSSSMTNLLDTPDANGTQSDAFLRDRETDKTEMISVSSDGEQGNEASTWAHVTADGREVIFESWATNLVDEPIAPGANIYVRDRVAGTTSLLEIAGEGQLPDGEVMLGAVSDDGRFVMFNSGADNLIPYDGNAVWDAFVHDRETGRTERISVANDGSGGDLDSYGWEMSPDGRFITFESDATNLVEGDTNFRADSFVRDRVLDVTRRISVASDGTQGNREANYASTSLDGSVVAFGSSATNLVEGDTNEEKDIFVRFVGLDVGIGELETAVVGDSVMVSGWAGFAGSIAGAGEDPAGDVADGSSDLIGATIVNRGELGSVQLRWDVAQLDPVGAPGIVYGASFDVDGHRWEVRGAPTVAGVPRFHLMDCASTCTRVGELRGRYGREGSTVVVTIPHETAPFSPSVTLSAMRMYTAAGESLVGTFADLDAIALGAIDVAAPSLRFGLAPAGTSGVAYGEPVAPESGVFADTVALGGADPADVDLWVEACLGTTCSTTIRALGERSALEGSVLTLDLTKERGDIIATVTLRSEQGVPLPARDIAVYLAGHQLGTVTTDASGVARRAIPRRDAKPGDVIEASFGGDGSYLPSAASRTVTVQEL